MKKESRLYLKKKEKRKKKADCMLVGDYVDFYSLLACYDTLDCVDLI